MSKIKQIFSNNKFFIGVTLLITFCFIQSAIDVLAPTATPASAVWCVFTGFVSLIGWATVVYDRSMSKFNAEFAAKCKEIEEKHKKLRG